MDDDSRHHHEHDARDRVERWIDLTADAAEVWKAVGDFGSIAEWHPAVEKCELVELDGARHRHLTLADGALLLERLEEEGDHHYRYSIVEGPLPVENYLSTITCFAEEGGCRVFWSSTFDPLAPDADKVVAGVYEAGLEAIRERFGD